MYLEIFYMNAPVSINYIDSNRIHCPGMITQPIILNDTNTCAQLLLPCDRLSQPDRSRLYLQYMDVV